MLELVLYDELQFDFIFARNPSPRIGREKLSSNWQCPLEQEVDGHRRSFVEVVGHQQSFFDGRATLASNNVGKLRRGSLDAKSTSLGVARCGEALLRSCDAIIGEVDPACAALPGFSMIASGRGP
ncbi:hypothetical protein NL676_030124 [Syzygium grande]|nr:hypothetical protein NL676_030124 [Syzygium grande]